MNSLRANLSIFFGCILPVTTQAYDLATHAKITNAAVAKSRLGSDITLLWALGIDGWVLPTGRQTIPFNTAQGPFYFDSTRSDVSYLRKPTSYEFNVMAAVGMANQSTRLSGWLVRGAIREDDGGSLMNRFKGEPRNDEPFGDINRFCDHFLDPVILRDSGRGFTGSCLLETPISDAAQWALGSQLPFASQPPENVERRNHFTILDAREAMWRGLTLRNRYGDPVSQNIGGTSFSAEDLRRIYWATAFRALGDVLHLVEDMGQPQHTRNEGHYPQNAGYEEYLEARARQVDEYRIDGQQLESGQLPDLTYSGYPAPWFNRYSDYWSTVLTSGNVWGLADYSNRGFFTPGSNIGNTTYPKPLAAASNYTAVRTVDFLGVNSEYLFGTVDDDVTNSTDGITVSTKSVFDGIGPLTSYTLSKRNYDDRAALLIPRAAAYSAGLLDYFFRGEMEISLPDSGVYAIVDHFEFAGPEAPPTDVSGFKGFGTIQLKLRNATPLIPAPDGNHIQTMDAGTLLAVAKFHRNTCYKDDLSGEPGANGDPVACRSAMEEIVVSRAQSVAAVPSTPKEFEFTFDQQIPINATDLYLQVVFRGALGEETDAVVVATQDLSEPSYITFMNATDYVAIGGHPVYCANTTLGCGSARETDASYQFYPQGVSGPAGARIGMHIPVQRIARVALLTDAKPDLQSIYNDAGVPPIQFVFGPAENQVNFLSDGSTFTGYTAVHLARGIYFGRTVYIWLVGTDGTLSSPSDEVPYGDMTVSLADTHPVKLLNLIIPLITP